MKILTSIQLANKIEGMNYQQAIEFCEKELNARRDSMGEDKIARFYYDGADDFYAFMFFASIDRKPYFTFATRPKFNFNHQIISYVS